MVKRIYVEKKRGFDVEAQTLFKELKDNLSIAGMRSLRVINRYDAEHITDETFEIAMHSVFSEPGIDEIYAEDIEWPSGAFCFGVEYLPGQYDQRADSAAQCIRLLDEEADPVVRYAKMIVIEGELSASEKEEIEKYCINPVDSRKAAPEKPETLDLDLPAPAPVGLITGFRRKDEKGLRDLIEELGLAMRYPDIKFIQDYFRDEEARDPSMTELRVLDTYWSDHCRHTTFLSELKDIKIENSPLIEAAFEAYLNLRKSLYGKDNGKDSNKDSNKDNAGDNAKDKPICLMDLATIGTKYIKKAGLADDLDESDEINACSIKVKAQVYGEGEDPDKTGPHEEDWLVMFKNETHNHPTEIEPFGGAATCLGGAIRDPLSGRVYVYQAMRVTGSGDPTVPLNGTLPGKLPQYRITRGAAKGYSSYGNQVGIATGLVDEIYHSGYIAKRMEIGAVIGAAPAGHVRREQPAIGDIIIIVGGRTGRDGLGGATGSSKEHTAESIHTAGAEVQKGNAPAERSVQRLFRRPEVTRLIKKCNDFGAGGVAVAIGELADSLDVDLDKVLKKYDGLDGTELAISESQERMAVLISPDDLKEFERYAAEENIEISHTATVTDTGRFRMMWRGDTVLDLSRKFIDTNGTRAERQVIVRDKDYTAAAAAALRESAAAVTKDNLLAIVEDLAVCGKRGLIEQFDSTIGSGTILMPLGGKDQLTPAAGMAAKLPVLHGDTDTVTLMTYGFDPVLSKASPFHGAVNAVVDSVTKIVALGGDASKVRLTFQEYFEKLGKVPGRWGKPFMALLGALKAQIELGIPAIGGKDSMSGTFSHLDVPPTLVSFAVGVSEARRVTSPEFKQTGSALIRISTSKDADGMPDFEQYKLNMKRVTDLIRKGRISSAQTIGPGGVFAATAAMALGNGIGCILRNLSDEELLIADYGSLILEIPPGEDASALFGGLEYSDIGETTGSDVIQVFPVAAQHLNGARNPDAIIVKLSSLGRRRDSVLSRVFPVDAATDPEREEAERTELTPLAYDKRAGKVRSASPLKGNAGPRIFIPVFPGTNCETDSAAAFRKAGGQPDLVNFVNISAQSMEESITRMTGAIKKSQIIMIPGGFSAGDEPEGSAKFIAAVFRNPYIKEAVTELLEQRDGLILGICNGFQALIKLGLISYGRIVSAEEVISAPTLTYNRIGRHQSRLVRTRVSSVLSPWLAGAEIGDVFTVPVSHGEGRFVVSDEGLSALIAGGQIATQYADESGAPSMDIRVNPNGSRFAIEGVTSPDGRIFGKMGHTERVGRYLYKNVPGQYESGIIESGVRYFK
ncbi:MAG: phosphoribosylformylglycinamidine synthase [Clostridiales Family XIII bacterium]|nr:phosphoribosylformylglycinamidine synthase [Clostridiales Family XIII bacterium]